MHQVIRFAYDETGAVTVDFVVLTAAIFTLGATVVFAVISGSENFANTTSESLETISVPEIGPL
ncbi:MAG: hypothetical protein EA339_11385 [Rhodobacteraceae bacterium]|nr:MAG: hypothetical protein EA339_11385 [Paracoccaceae bacterium]